MVDEKHLTGQVQKTWPTPRASDNESRTGKPPPSTRDGRHGKILEAEARNWPTPVKSDEYSPGDQGRDGGPGLSSEAANWATPRAAGNHQKNSGDDYVALGEQTKNWMTPRAQDSYERSNRKTIERANRGEAQLTLTRQVKGLLQWATPAARDWKSEVPEQSPDHSPPLGRQVLRTDVRGERSSPSTRLLNPRFVEWLMGFPIGWSRLNHAPTNPDDGISPDTARPLTECGTGYRESSQRSSTVEWTDYEPLETPWSLSVRRWRSYIYERGYPGLGEPPTEPAHVRDPV